MTRLLNVMKTASLVGAVAFGMAAASQADTILHGQDFESSPAAAEYASGDFDPVPIATGQEEVFELAATNVSPIVQVVSLATTNNGGPAGQVQVLDGQSLKLEANAGGGGAVYRVALPSPTSRATVQFDVYAVPQASNGSNRMFECWSGVGSGTGLQGWAFRVDEDGTFYYDNAGAIDTGIGFEFYRWNRIRISSDFTTSGNITYLTVNGTMYDNGGNGFARPDSLETVNNIERIQFQASSSAGPEAGVFYDNIWISDGYNTAEVVVAHTQTQVLDRATIDLTGSTGGDAVLEAASDVVTGDWTPLPYTYQPMSTVTAFATVAGSTAYRAFDSLLFHQGFEGDAAAAEFASGDFNPVPTILGSTQNLVSENAPEVVQVVSTATNPNGNPSDGVQVADGSQSLKMDANSGAGPFFQIDTPGGVVQTLRFSVYSDTGSAVGGGRLFEVWHDDQTVSGGVDIFGLRIDENGDLYYDNNGPWADTGFDLTHDQWNTFLIAMDTTGSNIMHLAVNNVPVMGGANLAKSSGDRIDRFQFQANNAAGTGAGIVYDDIRIYDGFITSSVSAEVGAVVVQESATDALEFDSVQGVNYQLQYHTNGVPPTWVSAPYTMQGTGGKALAFDPDGISTARTYRIIVQ